jgi:hypothetical protein
MESSDSARIFKHYAIFPEMPWQVLVYSLQREERGGYVF